MSQLACADTPDHAMNDRQIRMFREIRIMYRGVPSSLAHSSGIFLGGTVFCDLVRPGAALFGINPTPGQKNPMRPVVELKPIKEPARPVSAEALDWLAARRVGKRAKEDAGTFVSRMRDEWER